MAKNKIIVVHNVPDMGASYGTPFEKYGEIISPEDYKAKQTVLDNLSELLFVVFSGGSDVTPSLYGESAHPKTYNNKSRDIMESEVYEICKANNIPMVGICRGAQFLNVMNGGKLIQHVTGHHSNHITHIFDGRTILFNSSHHQMCLPTSDALLLAWTDPISPIHQDGNQKEIIVEKEVDCYFYAKTRCLGMQYHPEVMSPKSEGYQFCQEMTEKFIMGCNVSAATVK